MTAGGDREEPSPDGSADRIGRRIRMVERGPMLVEGPVEVECASGEVIRCDRFMVAFCMCGRSRHKPFCDTSHRRNRSRNRLTR